LTGNEKEIHFIVKDKNKTDDKDDMIGEAYLPLDKILDNDQFSTNIGIFSSGDFEGTLYVETEFSSKESQFSFGRPYIGYVSLMIITCI
jgi:hypothetical protein